MNRLIMSAIVLAGTAFAGSAGFRIKGEGIALGEPKEIHVLDANGMTRSHPPRFSAKVKKGRTFILAAHATAASRGQVSRPFEAESGEWTYDRTMLKALPLDKKRSADKTVIAVRFKAIKTGATNIHFTGKVLGYENKFDVSLEVN